MANTREKLTTTTVAIHWLVAFAIIGMIAFGLYLEDMPRSAEKGYLVGLHKDIGVLVLALVIIRIIQRLGNRFPSHVGKYAMWEIGLSHLVQAVLALGILLMPIFGLMMVFGGGHDLSFFGLTQIGPFGKNELVSKIGHIGHGLTAKILIGAITLHVLGALKHHLVDKDGTIKRMAGKRVEIYDEA